MCTFLSELFFANSKIYAVFLSNYRTELLFKVKLVLSLISLNFHFAENMTFGMDFNVALI